MAAVPIFESTVIGTGTGGTTQIVTVPYSGVTGNNCVAVLLCSARVIGTTYNTSATFDAVGMSLAVEASAALGGFGEGSATVFYLPLGDLVGAAGNAVFTMTSSNGSIGRIATLVIVPDVNQATPLRDTSSATFVSSASSSSIIIASLASDLALDCITLGGASGLVVGGLQTLIDELDNGAGNGDAMSHGSSHETATGSATTMSWTFSQSFAHAGATFIEDIAATGPTITQVTPASVKPSDTNITVDGTNFTLPGTTLLILSPLAGPGDPLAESQSISGIGPGTMNWDSVNLGGMSPGPLMLTVRTDAGGGGQQDSPPFPLVVSDPDVHWATRSYVTAGATGVQIVVDDLPFVPKAAFIQITGNSLIDTLQAGCELGQCFVDELTSMGIGLAAQASPVVTKRKQQLGTGSLFIMDGSADAAPDFVVGTPALTSDGLTINFTANTSGYRLGIGFVGGNSVQASLNEIQISDGALSGLPFQPKVLFGTSANMATGSGADTSFARQSFGVAIGAGTAQFNQSTDMDSAASRNTEILQGTFLAQLGGEVNQWTMSITALTADGYTWSGSNPDGAFVIAIDTDIAELFLTQFASTQAADGASEDLPDSGIANPGILFMTSAGRVTTGPSGAIGARWSSGSSVPGEVQGGGSVMFNPDAGVGTTEQNTSIQNIIESSSVAGTLTLESRIIDFKQAPTIQYIDNPEAGIFYNMFMAEDLGVGPGGDDEGVSVNIW